MPTFYINTAELIAKINTTFEQLFNVTLGTWKTDPVEIEIKQYVKPICSKQYTVPKVHQDMFLKIGLMFSPIRSP